ncbi:MAG: hypothetical protein ACYCZ1_09050 [Candidatus Humimicrobiaceae bacterium]
MRKLLIAFSIINTGLYFIIYSYFDYILENSSALIIPALAISFIKILFLITIGFSAGLVVSIIRGFDGVKSTFDYKMFIMLSIVPVVMLLLSGGQVTNFIIVRFFNANKKLAELAFYIFSRDYIWALLTGFIAGACVKLRFKRNRQLRITNNWEVR